MYLRDSKIIVIKIGSSLLIDQNKKIRKKWLIEFSKNIQELLKQNKKIIIVSSGAIAMGCKKLNLSKKNIKLDKSQAVASIGQIELMNLFTKIFWKFRINISQILLTLEDTEQRRRALNAKRTFENLFELGFIPIVNENDSIATSEIKYGDNDRLAARVAQIIGADLLIILSDVDGLYEKISNKKSLIKEVNIINEKIIALVDKKNNTYGSGGMLTKLEAAKICMNAGCNMLIANGKNFNPIQKIINKKLYTWFKPRISNLDARKKWIISSLSSSARIYIDQGASKALKSGKSLLPAGIIKITGNFKKGDNIIIVDNNNTNIARALSSFTSDEINKIKGLQSSQIENILGYASKSEIVHKDDIVIL
jgi:glutamate 5-kinase